MFNGDNDEDDNDKDNVDDDEDDCSQGKRELLHSPPHLHSGFPHTAAGGHIVLVVAFHDAPRTCIM